MKKQNKNKVNTPTLRQKAEENLKLGSLKPRNLNSEAEYIKLIHELDVHQIELEMQNMELSALKEREVLAKDKYTELYDYAPTGYVTISKEGFITELNFRAAAKLGKERASLIQNSFAAFVSFETRPVFNLFFERILAYGIKESCEVMLNSKTGSILYIQIDGILNQNKTQCLLTITDISERKQLEKELLEAKEMAEQSDRLKTAFLQNISHEIRTPMNAIIGFSRRLDKPDLPEETRKSFTEIIITSTNQLLDIINDVLTISSLEAKQEKVSMEIVCINEIMANMLATFKKQAYDKNIAIYKKTELTDKQAELYTDAGKVKQILLHLLTNALKFTPNGFVEFGYTIKDTIHGSMMEFYVKDSGIGIASDMREKIFDNFRQAESDRHKRYSGTGIGLSIAKGFAELLGGKIWLESEIGAGATFYFSIPFKLVN